MSKTIDERVVSMQFDNRHFESNVKTTMSTLDKLKAALKLDGAAKSLDGLSTSVNKINVNPLARGVESVTAKFSALEVMGVTALANITNSAVNAGKRIAAALTIEPLKTGFQEYETQINAVQTILANTSHAGTDIDDVNAALDELNTYADKTIYNFTEMTRNIGTFTAAGVDLETSVNAIQGIANLAAVSGSTSQQASTAMYQLSQALAAGTIRLMDWNSVVNAGMGGKVFQDALVETSELLETGAKKAIKASGSFRESLKDEWLTAEVLTETLKKFTESGAVDYIADLTGLTGESVKELQELGKTAGYDSKEFNKLADSLTKGKKEMKEQIVEALKFADTATQAATKVKTFTQLLDTLKESIQSGWTQTWEILIGDFEEAKELWSGISDFLTGNNGLITRMSNARNAVLEAAMDSPWKKLLKVLNKSGVSATDLEEAVRGIVGESQLDKLIEDCGSLEKVFQKGALSADILRKAMDKLKGSSVDLSNVTRKLKFGDTGEDVKKVQEALVKLGYELPKYGVDGLLKSETEAAIKAFQKMEGLAITGIVDDETLNALKEATATTTELKETVDEIINSITKRGGRDMILEAFKNIGAAIGKILGGIKDAWNETFKTNEIDPSEGIYNMIESLHEFSLGLSNIDDIVEKVNRIAKGIFAFTQLFTTFGSKIAVIGFKTLRGLFGVTNYDILELAASLGDALVEVKNLIFNSELLAVDINKISDAIVGCVVKVAEWIKAFIALPGVQRTLNSLKAVITGVTDAITGLLDGSLSVAGFFKQIGYVISSFINRVIATYPTLGKLVDFLKSFGKSIGGSGIFQDLFGGLKDQLAKAYNAGKDIIAGIEQGLKDGTMTLGQAIIEAAKAIYESFCAFFGINSPSTLMIAAGGFIIAGLVIGLLSGKGQISEAVSKIGETVKSGFATLTEHLKKIDFGKVAAALIAGAMLYLTKRFIDVVEMFASPIGKLGKMFDAIGGAFKGLDKIFDSIAFENKTKGIKNIAASLAILLGAVAGLAFVISKYEVSLWDLGKVVIIIGVLALALAGLAWGMSKFADSAASFQKVGDKTTFNLKSIAPKLIALGAALLMMAGVIALLGKMKSHELKQGLISMAEVIGAMVGVLLAFRLLSIQDTGSLNSAGKTMKDVAIALLLMVGVVKLAAGLDRGEIERGTAFVVGFGVFLALMSRACSSANGREFYKFGSDAVLLTIAMGLMVGVVKLASYLKPDELKKGALFAAGFTAFVWAITKVATITSNQQLVKIGGLILSMSIGLLAMVGVCKLVGKLTTEEIVKGIAFVIIFGILIRCFVDALTVGSKQKVAEAAGTITAFAIAIAALAGVSVVLGMIPIEYLAKGIVAVGLLTIMMRSLVTATKGANGKNVMRNLIVLTTAIGLMAAAVAGLSIIAADNPESLITAVGAMAIMMGMFALMIASTSKMKNTKSALTTLLTMSGIVAVLAIVVGMLSQITNPDSAIQATTALAIVLGSLMGCLLVIEKLDKRKVSIGRNLAGAIAGMIVVVLTLGTVVAILSWITNPDAIVQKMTALSIVLLAMSGVLVVLSKIKVGSLDLVKKVGVLAAMAVPLAAFALALNYIPMGNIAGKQDAIIVLGLVMAAMTGLLLALTAISKYIGGVGKMAAGIIGLTAMVIPLVAFGFAIDSLPTISDKRETLATITTTMVAMTGLLLALTLIGSLIMALGAVGAVAGVIGLTAMLIPLCAFGFAINAIPNITDKSATITILTGVMKTMTELLAVLSVLGLLAIGGIVGMVELTMMCGLLVGLAWAIEWIPDISSSVGTITILLTVMTTLTTLLGYLAIIGPKAIVGTAALGILVGLIESVAVFAAGLGALMTWIPAIEDFLNKGMPMMEQISKSLGTMIGNFIAGFGESVTSSLPKIAMNLTIFMTMLRIGVISNLQAVDETAVNGAKNVAKILVALGGAQLASAMSSLMSWLTGTSISDMSSQLQSFAKAVVEFSNTLTQGNIDTAAIQAAADAGQMLAALSKSMPRTGGWWQEVIGESDMADFGAKMVAFGACLLAFSKTVSAEGAINIEAIRQARDAGLAMDELADAVPRTGGWWQEIIGEADIAAFGRSMVAYGGALLLFSNAVSLEGAINIDAIHSARDAGLAMNELADVIPRTGGIWQDIMGESDMATFGLRIAAFGAALVAFSETVAPGGSLKINPVAVTAAVLAGQLFAALNAALPETKGVFQKFCEFFTGGSMTMEQFGNELAGFGEAVGKFCESTTDINAEGLDLMASAIQKLVKCIKNMEGITTDGISDFKDAVNDLSDVDVTGFYESFTADKADNAASAVKKILNLIKSMVGLDSSGIATFKDALSQLATVEITKFVDAFSSAATELAQAGTDMMAGLVKGITNGAPQVLTITRTVLLRTSMLINSSAPQFMISGVLLANYLTKGLSAGYQNVMVVTRSALTRAAMSIMTFYSTFSSTGKFLGSGLVSGINAKQSAAYNAGYALGLAAARGVAKGAKVESPSKLTIATGNWIGKGLVIGIGQMGNAVTKAGSGIGKLATDSISNAVAKVTDLINTDMDTSPTIRPVLDLTDVTNGANRLNSLFATNQTVGLMANVGYASASMAAAGQNGGNGDVVSAINKLSKKMDNLSNNTTNINGITYDDGSAVSQAVGTLTRAMRMERRI